MREQKEALGARDAEIAQLREARPTEVPGAITVTDAFSPKFSQCISLIDPLNTHGCTPFYIVFTK